MNLFIPAAVSHLPVVLEAIRAEAAAVGFHQNDLWKLELPLEEAIVNIIRHAQTDEGVEVSIERTDPAGLSVTIIDRGVAFDPLEAEQLTDSSVIGGQGVALMRKCLDTVQYRRESDTNILTLIKYV